MEIHYNAFISYRHHPDDIKVAEDIHRRLERFKIPKAIKKRGSGALRLFRDKEELPVTSSLSSDIYRALENSDYLIVICSPHTKESVWVQREIETFLQTHSRDQILTVLTEGEPYDVLPEILIHEDVVNPVTGELERHDYEPLSCDWRLKKRRCIREELPRLAAALFGCGYDELRQRQRQYQMRRMVALFSAALVASLCLAAYFIHTSLRIQKANDDLSAANAQVRESLNEALKNQSKYLASAASERMEAGDRLTALSLALEALPSQDNARPYVPEAEWALSNALRAYNADAQLVAQGAFLADALVRQYTVSEDGEQLVILDARMVLTVWNTKTFQKHSTIDLSARSVDSVLFTATGNILVTTSNDDLLCYQPDGTLLWQAEHCTDVAFLDNRSQVLAIQNDYDCLQQYSVFDADSGEQLAGFSYAYPELDCSPSSFLQLENDSALPVLVRYGTFDMDYVLMLDVQSGTLQKVTEISTSLGGDGFSLNHAALDSQGNIILMCGDGSGFNNGNYGTFQIVSPAHSNLVCYDAQTLEIKWQSEITDYTYSNTRTIKTIPGTDQLLIQSGETIQIHDANTGEKLSHCILPSIPLCLVVDAAETWGVVQNGAYFSYNYAQNQCHILPIADGTPSSAIIKGGLFFHTPLESQVVVYRSISDTEGVVYTGENTSLLSDCYISGDHLLNWSGSTLEMFDAKQKKMLWQQKLSYSWKVLGFSEDGTRLWMKHNVEHTVMEFCTADGTQETLPLTLSIGDTYTSLESNFFLANDKLLYILETDGLTQLERVDLNTCEKDLTLQLPQMCKESTDYRATTELLLVSDAYAWILQEETVFVIDLQTGVLRELLANVSSKPVLAWNPARSDLVVAAGNRLLLTHPEGSISLSIDLGVKKCVSAFLCDEQILVLCDDGAVYRYDLQGNFLSKIGINLYNTFFSKAASGADSPMEIYWWQTGDGDLILNVFGAGNIIDCSQWQSRAFVPNMFVYVSQYDEVVCCANNQLYAFPRYTTEQQMHKAREALGDFRLSEDQLASYGLS